jgi:hypothetical protein
VVPAVEAGADAIFVARVVAQGYTELLFYVPAERADAFPGASIGDVSPYALEWFSEEDAAWEIYGELYPNAYAIQSIWNRRLVEQMTKNGDQIELAREIDHLVVFPTLERARQASAALTARGFRVEEPEQRDHDWSLEFHRVDRCDGDRPDEFVFEILDVVLPLEGAFDGWGSVLTTKPPN